MKFKKLLSRIIICVLIVETAIFLKYEIPDMQFRLQAQTDPGQTVAVRTVDPQITADGIVTAQNQATLHFLTGGKLVSLPLKEGDQVKAGQMIAQLDTYALQRQLSLAANAYQMAKNTTDQTVENQQAGVVEGQQRTTLDTTNKNSYSSITESQVVSDTVQRLVNSSILTQNSAQLNVDLASYALQLATLSSPITGVVTHEDVTLPGINVTPLTGFTVADPTTKVFRVFVAESDIDYVSEGNKATIHINGLQTPLSATVEKIYPAKTTLQNGEQVYQVDLSSDQLSTLTKLDQSGTVLIQSNAQANMLLIPAWTVLNGKYIWIEENNREQLKEITPGKVHGGEIEVLNGLTPADKVIVDPKAMPEKEYQML